MSKLLFGSDYYPEDWDESIIESEAAKMKENGFNAARIGEFAWAKDEPREGEFHFEWLHKVIDTLARYGIKTIMGTPTATPPAWLYNRYPEIAQLNTVGIRKSHGGRRHCCSSNPIYQKYCKLIVEKLAREFANDKNVIGWQIDNEIYPAADACLCDDCKRNFHKYLENKYGTIEKLNESWNLNLFSQKYDNFEQIPFPVNGWHNPHILLEWHFFKGQTHIDFVAMQADILHKYVSVPVGTDTMPLAGYDYRKMEEKLDVVQFNHYNLPENLDSAAFWFDYLRPFSKRPLWNTETQPCWNGSTAFGMKLLPENYIYYNSCLPFILGGEANLYWLWRTHWAGHELMHGGVYDSCGRETYANAEIRKAASDMRKIEDFLVNAKVVSDFAVTFTALNSAIKVTQIVDNAYGLDGCNTSDLEIRNIYRLMSLNGMHPDLIDMKENISSYKVILSPLAYTLEDGNFKDEITAWVNNGGVWIVGPLSDIRTNIGAKYKDAPYGFLENLTGAHLKYTLPDDNNLLTVQNENGENITCGKSYELFDDAVGKPILTVTDGHSVFKSLKCCAEYKVGNGSVIILGTMPENDELLRIIKYAANKNNATALDTTDAFCVIRSGNGLNGIIVSSLQGNKCTFNFNGRKKDLLTGKIYDGKIEIQPFGIAVLTED